MLRRIGQEHQEGRRVPFGQLREIVKEQVFLMELDGERALAALPKLVPTEQARRAVIDAAQQLLGARGTPHPDEIARLHQVKGLLHLDREAATRANEPDKAHRQAG
jgi:hypothetical protein